MEKQKINTNMKQIKCIIVSCFAIICVALFGSVFTSCSNDDDLLLASGCQSLINSTPSDYVSVEFVKLDSTQTMSTRGITAYLDMVTATSWGVFPELSQASGVGQTLSPGTYAVKFSRKLFAPYSVKVRTYYTGTSVNCKSYGWNYLFASDNTQISMTTPLLREGQAIYDKEIIITGSQYTVFVLQVIVEGNYVVQYYDDEVSWQII